MRELLEIRAPDEIHGGDLRRTQDVLCQRRIETAAADEHGYIVCMVETVCERGKMLHRPAFVRPVCPDGKGDKRPPLLHPLTREQRIRRHAVTVGDADGKAHLAHAAAKRTRDIEITLDNMPLSVCAAHGTAHEMRPLAHIRRADA